MPGTALQPHSDNSGFTLSHIPRHNSVVQAIDASGQNVSHTFELAWARGLHLHSLCFSVPGTQSSGATCFPCCHSKQLMWACVCLTIVSFPPRNTPYLYKPSDVPLPLSQVSNQNSSSTPLRQAQGHSPSPSKDHPRSKWIARKPQKGTKSCTLPWPLETT